MAASSETKAGSDGGDGDQLDARCPAGPVGFASGHPSELSFRHFSRSRLAGSAPAMGDVVDAVGE